MNLLHVGSTGLVGRHALDLALEDPRVRTLVAPVRRPLQQRHRKLLAPVVDFDALPADAPWWRADAVICTLGTTMRQAGSKEAFRKVDLGYPLAVARLAREHGTQVFALNSAIGAHAGSAIFYNRVKGELEHELQALGFRSLTFVRPGLIGGRREDARPGEGRAGRLIRVLGPLVPRRWRINPAEKIAARLLEAAVDGKPGTHVVASAELV
ncbi:NAD-dependent dehydratase [Lysobacter sp. GX 14042]|uniref:NAD-dependent dehydratase n=1 Tax=Lysobacter sp. GX 14042 TaxID=2907155 RepID=UPI001F25656C|nr:NAD-dependent dehydratase [Lysobacter sp. GX 14042]MCE7032534.1 NAD-dependent dehydratase [Lysobacter sp. GX 14042]